MCIRDRLYGVLSPFIPIMPLMLIIVVSEFLLTGGLHADGPVSYTHLVALDDNLHVPYRKTLIPHCDKVFEAAKTAGAYGATISGSGSTLIAYVDKAHVQDAVSYTHLDVYKRQALKSY